MNAANFAQSKKNTNLLDDIKASAPKQLWADSIFDSLSEKNGCAVNNTASGGKKINLNDFYLVDDNTRYQVTNGGTQTETYSVKGKTLSSVIKKIRLEVQDGGNGETIDVAIKDSSGNTLWSVSGVEITNSSAQWYEWTDQDFGRALDNEDIDLQITLSDGDLDCLSQEIIADMESGNAIQYITVSGLVDFSSIILKLNGEGTETIDLINSDNSSTLASNLTDGDEINVTNAHLYSTFGLKVSLSRSSSSEDPAVLLWGVTVDAPTI